AVGDAAQLPADGGVDRRLAMAMEVGPDRGVCIEVFPAARVAKQRPFALGDDDRPALDPIAHLRERVPDKLAIKPGKVHRSNASAPRPTARNASANCSMSELVCAAETVRRRRALPRATVG